MIPIQQLAQNIIRQYDRNGDGVIDLRRGPAFEGERLEQNVQTSYHQDTVNLSWVSLKQLFAKADSNGDQQVTQQELMQVISLFDDNRNGYLEYRVDPRGLAVGELANLNRAYPEERGLVSTQVIPKANTQYVYQPNYWGIVNTIGTVPIRAN